MATELTYTDRASKKHTYKIGFVDRAKLVIFARGHEAFSDRKTKNLISVEQLIAKKGDEITFEQMKGTLAALGDEGLTGPALKLKEFLAAALKERKHIIVN